MTLTRVAAFGRWRKLGYRVRAGEKGLRIFGPVTRRLRADEVASWLPGGGTRSTQLTSVELGGGATLKVHKSDVTTPYSRCVPGEQLRLKVATAVALLRAGFTTRIEIGDQVSLLGPVAK